MLLLSRRQGEIITINDDIRIVVVEFNRRGNQVKLGFDAPPNQYKIHRGEIYQRIQEEKALKELCNDSFL